MNEFDIRLCPWYIGTLDGVPARIYEYAGYKAGLTTEYRDYPHAWTFLYTLVCPDGTILKDIDLAEVNRIVFNKSKNED